MKAAQGKAECQRQNRVEVTGKAQLGTDEGPSASDQNGELRVAWQVMLSTSVSLLSKAHSHMFSVVLAACKELSNVC